ncbi:hypothetical protein JCM9279_007542 [Rhodotorula babjevae]
MRYLEDGAAREDVSLVFLPARAASVAMALSSTASFVAVVFLARLTVDAPLETGHVVLVAFTAATFLTFVCTGLIIAYARFLPPPTTRIWDLVRGIVSYLFLLWIICFGLSGAVLGEVLLPLKSCTGPYPSLCLTTLRSRSNQIIVVLSVALAASLALCILVSLDLRSTHPRARVVVLRSELAAQRVQAAQAGRVRAMQAALEAPLLQGDERDSAGEERTRAWVGAAGAASERSRSSTVQAYAARARLPVDGAEEAWLPDVEAHGPLRAPASRRAVAAPASSGKDALGVPVMFSPGKRHRHTDRRRLEATNEEEEPHRPRRAPARGVDERDEHDDGATSTASSRTSESGATTASSSDDDAPRARAPPRSHRHRHAADSPSSSSSSTSTSSSASPEDDASTTEERAPGKHHHERARSSRRRHSSSAHHEREHERTSGHHHRQHRHDDEHPHRHRRRSSRGEMGGESEEEERRRERRKRRKRKLAAEARTADVNATRMETASAGAAGAEQV